MQSSYQMSYNAQQRGGAPQAGTFNVAPTVDWGSGSTGAQPQAQGVQFGGGSIFGGGSAPLVQDSGEYNSNATSVREYAYEEDKNMRFRP